MPTPIRSGTQLRNGETHCSSFMCYNPQTDVISRYSPENGRWEIVRSQDLPALKVDVSSLPQWRENGNTCSPSSRGSCDGEMFQRKSEDTQKPRQKQVNMMTSSDIARIKAANPHKTIRFQDGEGGVVRSQNREGDPRMPRSPSPYPRPNLLARSRANVSMNISLACCNISEHFDSSNGGSACHLSRSKSSDSSQRCKHAVAGLKVACYKLAKKVKLNEPLQQLASMPRRPDLSLQEVATVKYQELKERVREFGQRIRGRTTTQ